MELETITTPQKKAWIEALESGKFKQGTGRMHKPADDTYCCLGVLAKTLNLDMAYPDFNYEVCRNLLGTEIQGDCITANDDYLQLSFNEIAETFRGYWDILD